MANKRLHVRPVQEISTGATLMVSERTLSRWQRQRKAMSRRWHPVGLYFDHVSKRKEWERKRNTPGWEQR